MNSFQLRDESPATFPHRARDQLIDEVRLNSTDSPKDSRLSIVQRMGGGRLSQWGRELTDAANALPSSDERSLSKRDRFASGFVRVKSRSLRYRAATSGKRLSE